MISHDACKVDVPYRVHSHRLSSVPPWRGWRVGASGGRGDYSRGPHVSLYSSALGDRLLVEVAPLESTLKELSNGTRYIWRAPTLAWNPALLVVTQNVHGTGY